MISIRSLEEADANSRTVDVHGQKYLLQEFVGAAPLRGTYVDGNEANDNSRPQGFLVTQPPGSVTPPHFHETDQFQVFVEGDGFFGKKAVSPVTVQFAGGHTPYGPIRAGDGGVRYYTLRQRWDPGAKYMPKMRDRLVRGRQRQQIGAVEEDTLPAAGDVNIFDTEADGMFARYIRLQPDTAVPGPDPGSGAGQYQVVIRGSLVMDGRDYGRLAVRHVSQDEAPPEIRAGADGLDLLVMQFPRRESG